MALAQKVSESRNGDASNGTEGDESEHKVALITGITGQDGSYLAHFLMKKGYNVIFCYTCHFYKY